jgi:periplasmic protein CpxP/Spy
MKIKLVNRLLVVATLATIAFNTNTVQAQIAQNPPPPISENGKPPIPPFLRELDLSSEQQSQIAEITKNSHQEIDRILTPEQNSKLKAAIASGKKPREAMKSLNLTPEQKQKMKAVRRSQREQITSILTPEQKQKLRANRHSREPM